MKKKTLALVTVVLAVLGLQSCVKWFRPHMAGTKKEWIVLAVHTDSTGACRLVEKTPGEIRTQSGSNTFWIIAGTCSGTHTIAIDRQFKKGGQTYDLFENTGTTLDGTIPSSVTGPSVILRGKLKNNLEKGRYTYTIKIDGQPAEFNSRADDGEYYLCPVWPCGFRE